MTPYREPAAQEKEPALKRVRAWKWDLVLRWGFVAAVAAFGIIAVALITYHPDSRCVHTHPQIVLMPIGKGLFPIKTQVLRMTSQKSFTNRTKEDRDREHAATDAWAERERAKEPERVAEAIRTRRATNYEDYE